MKRLITAAVLFAVLGAPAYAGDRHRHWHHDRGSSTSDTVNTLLKLQLLGLAVQGMSQPSTVYVERRSLKDPYYQPYVQGDPYPPQRPLK